MAAGYWIAHLYVHDVAKHSSYIVASTAAIRQFGGRFLVRGGSCDHVEGVTKPRDVVIEFPTYAAALACYQSAEYASARALRANTAAADICIVEGCSEISVK